MASVGYSLWNYHITKYKANTVIEVLWGTRSRSHECYSTGTVVTKCNNPVWH